MNLYVKSDSGKFIPVEIDSIMSKDLNDHLVIVKVGNDKQVASLDDLDLTASSFAKADVLDDLDNVSVIITPYQIDIDLVSEREIEEKSICIQITSGEDVSSLDEATKNIYKKLSKNYNNLMILPSPLKLKEYEQVKDTLRRCKMRKKRRSRT
jgi:hypothetical protein